jgi:TPR repeat protein
MASAAPKALQLIELPCRDGLLVIEHDREQSCSTMKVKRAIAAILLVSADQGDAVVEFLLGDQYANGKGVPQDYSEAMLWFQKAAEQGHPVAKLYLGVMYAKAEACRRTMFVPTCGVVYRRHRVSKERSRL